MDVTNPTISAVCALAEDMCLVDMEEFTLEKWLQNAMTFFAFSHDMVSAPVSLFMGYRHTIMGLRRGFLKS